MWEIDEEICYRNFCVCWGLVRIDFWCGNDVFKGYVVVFIKVVSGGKFN